MSVVDCKGPSCRNVVPVTGDASTISESTEAGTKEFFCSTKCREDWVQIQKLKETESEVVK